VVWVTPSFLIFLIIVVLESSVFSRGGGKVVYYLMGIRGPTVWLLRWGSGVNCIATHMGKVKS
jgi:hypothetical protein